jgi:hypothetical protein
LKDSFSKNKDISLDLIATLRYQFKVNEFLYKRKKARWVTLYSNIHLIIQEPGKFEESYLKKKFSDKFELDEMVLKPLKNNIVKLLAFRFLSVLSLLFCLFMLATEATVLFNTQKTVPYIVNSWI